MSKIDLILEYIIAKESAEDAKSKYNYEYAEYHSKNRYPYSPAHLEVLREDYMIKLERVSRIESSAASLASSALLP